MARVLLVLCAGPWAALAACTSPPPVRTTPYADEALTAARAALGFDQLLSHAGGYELIGERAEALGTSPFRFAFDGTGRAVLDVAGAAPRAEGCDTDRVWSQDQSGLVRELGLGEAERVRCEAWLRTGLWLDPWTPRLAATIEPALSTPERVGVLLARPDSPFRATVWLDAATSLPAEYELEGEGRRVRLEAYARVGGVRLPHRFVHVFAGGAQVVETVALATPTAPPSFGPPRPLPRDTTFSPTAAADVEARLGADGRVYVRATLDAGRDVTMLLDSGFGASAIDPAVANALGWADTGASALDGIGGRAASRWRRSGSLTLGPMTVTGLDLVELDPYHPTAMAGFPVEGVIGSDVLSRAVLELDVARGEVRVHDASRPQRSELAWRKLVLDGTAPCVDARIGLSEPLWLRLDMGSSDTLSVAPWAVRALRLAPSVVELEAVHLVGPFGSRRGWRGELTGVEVAGTKLNRMPATFLDPVAEPGPLDDPWIAGNLGLPALRTMRIVLDLARRRIALVPRG